MSAASRRTIWCVRALALAFVLAALPAGVSAQYFGANKVQYRALRFRVLKTEHFDIHFQQDERESVDLAASLAERWWARLSRFFGHSLDSRQQIVVYRTQVDFEQTPIVDGALAIGTRGFTEPWRRRIAMPFAGSLVETDHIIGHELVHAFQFEALSRPAPPGEQRSGAPLPRWFIEGLAEYLSLGAVDPHTAMWLRDAVRVDRLPSLRALQHPGYFPYRWGHAFWAYVGGRWGDDEAARFFTVAAWAGVSAAIERVLGLTADQLVADWHAVIEDTYLRGTEGLAPVGWPVLAGHAIGRSSNSGPAMSPDGRWLAFLSERPAAVGLFVADAMSGDVVASLTAASDDPDDTNAQFADSAGAWDREGRRLAVATVSRGRAGISVFAWPGGARELEVAFDDVDEIYGPTWSPDGRSLAFTGSAGGVADLFVYDLQHATLRRLTDDAFADMQPAWEPDGRRIAFVTDRFTTDTAALTFGEYRVALIDADTGGIQPVPALPAGKHICPQWSPDGRQLYVISDWDGISNLYRIELATGDVRRLTAVLTGLSGVTPLSPALSVAGSDGTVAFTVYERGRFTINTLIPGTGQPVDTEPVSAERDLPPVDLFAVGATSTGWLANEPAIAPRARWSVSPYRPRFSLEHLSPPAFSVGADRFRAATATGFGVVLSDLLNSHWIVAALELNQQLEPGLRGTGAYAGYLNQVHRWKWGAIATVAPSLTGRRIGSGGAPPRVSLIRQTEHAGTLLASYALDRARRVEFTAGVSRLSFDGSAGGDLGPAGELTDPVTLGIASAALVSDRTVPGPMSILRGERFRVEASPTVGTIQYLNVLADYRRYITPLPFYTVAGRAIHIGRYGAGADDPRMPPLYLGYPALVRGYAASPPAAADHLFGSRMAVGNVELRFPLLRPFTGVSRWMYGGVPLEVALFADGGLVWGDSSVASREHASAAWSTGVTVRTSIFGLGLGQLDVARPFRGRGGWVVQFNLVPAF